MARTIRDFGGNSQIDESWVQDDVTSSCIDSEDPMSPTSLEPVPHGGIVNMGAYGDTAEASKSPFNCSYELDGSDE